MHSTKPDTLNQESGPMDYICLSPHLDDAVLSCGATLLTATRKRVAVVTFFTEGNDTIKTRDSKAFLRECGIPNATDLFKKRRREDRAATGALSVTNIFHAGLTDALFRTDPETGAPFYVDYRAVFSGRVHPRDPSPTRVMDILSRLAASHITPNTTILAPMGVGDHADHLIVRNGARSLFGRRVLYYEDVPYRSTTERVIRQCAILGASTVTTTSVGPVFAAQKRRAIALYDSQFRQLLAAGLSDIDYVTEKFYAL